MDNLFFYTSLGLITYYFLVYLPAQKSHSNSPVTYSKSTQTENTASTGYEPGPNNTFNCLGPQAIPDPENEVSAQQTIQNLTKQKQTLLADQAQKEKTIKNLNTKHQQALQRQQKESETSAKQIQQLKKQIKQS